MAEKTSGEGGEVVINVPGEGPKGSAPKEPEALDLDPKQNSKAFGPAANKPPKVPIAGNETPFARRRSFSKPKSRFGEQSCLLETDEMEDYGLASQEQIGGNSPYRHSFSKVSPNNKLGTSHRTDSAVSKTLSMASTGPNGENTEYEEIIKKVKLHNEKLKGLKPKVVIEWVIFLLLLGCLIASLTADKLKRHQLGDLKTW